MNEPLIPLSEVEAMVSQALYKLAMKSQQPADWADTDPAYRLLGYSSSKELLDAVKAGLFRVGKGKEVRDRRKPGSQKPIYQFHIQRCHARLEEPPEQRRPD
jgi:hypothetical protein